MRYVLSGDIAEQKSFLAHDCVSQCISTHLVYLHNANVGLPIVPIFHFLARPVIQRALLLVDLILVEFKSAEIISNGLTVRDLSAFHCLRFIKIKRETH